MNSRLVLRAFVALSLSAAALPAAAQLLGTTARQAPSGSLKLLAYYQGVSEQTLKFGIARGAICGANAPGVTFPCSGAADVEAEGSGNGGMLKLAYQAIDYVQPYVVLGTGDYRLKVPSTTIVNTLSGDKLGIVYGGGIKASVVPDTQFGPAAALDFGVTRSHYSFHRISPGGTPGASTDIDDRLTLMTYQLAVEASHRFGRGIEPYGGVKWMRVDAELKDLASGTRANGTHDSASPFIGLRVAAGERAGFFAEGSFVDGYHYAVGLDVRFN